MKSLCLFSFVFLFGGFAYGQTQFPAIKAEYVKPEQLNIYRKSDIKLPASRRRLTGKLNKNQKIIPCIHVDEKGNGLRDNQGHIYVGFKLAPKNLNEEEFLWSLLSSDHSCPSFYKDAIAISGLTTKNPNRIVRESDQIKPPVVKAWLTQELAKLSQTDFKNPTYYESLNPLDLAHEFHNTHCPNVNRDILNRTDKLKSLWAKFIKEKKKVSSKAYELAKTARTIDFVTRTVLYESHISYGCTEKAACERAIITLSIKNRGEDRKCGGSNPFGCRFNGDYEGVATEPSQYNIWFPHFSQTSHLTGCFFRKDLQKGVNDPAKWSGTAGKSYHERIVMFEDAFVQNLKLLYSKDITNYLNADSNLFDMKHYYHPAAMPKCAPDTYSKSSWITAAYAKAGQRNFLVRRTRIMTTGPNADGREAFNEYTQSTGEQRNTYPGTSLLERDIDRTHSMLCTKKGVNPNCSFPESKSFKKMPKWALNAIKPTITCSNLLHRGNSCSNPTRVANNNLSMGGQCSDSFMPIIQ